MSDNMLKLISAMSKTCQGYDYSSVMAASLMIAESTIEEIHLAIIDENIFMDATTELAHQMTAERLEYMAQLLRGNPATDPHESLKKTQ